MIFIDRNAYTSRLKKIDPVIKTTVAIIIIFISLFANSYLVSGIIIIIINFVVVKYGGTKLKLLTNLMALPISFLMLSVITIIIQSSDNSNNLLMSIKILNIYYGVSIYSLDLAGRLIFKAIAAISCMYFIALTTPMTEVFFALRRLRIPKLVIELMELIYRFIFILTETANQIYIAQTSRLGYNGLYAIYKSLGILISMLFDRAYKRSDKVYIALESRGYDGKLNIIDGEYDRSFKYYLYSGIFIAILIIISLLERLVII